MRKQTWRAQGWRGELKKEGFSYGGLSKQGGRGGKPIVEAVERRKERKGGLKRGSQEKGRKGKREPRVLKNQTGVEPGGTQVSHWDQKKKKTRK